MLSNGHWTDFISDFMLQFEHVQSPVIFKKWTAIAVVAGALERRVWISTGKGLAFPNLYVLLMAAPGIGKNIIDHARELWRATVEPGTKLRAFHVAPDNMSKASLLDTLARSKSLRIPPTGPPEIYHSLLIAAEEFSVLFPAYDNEYLGVLNSIWNVKADHQEVRRTGSVKELNIDKPLINILAGYQPALMATIFPEEAWASGLSRRLIMIYSSEAPFRDLFYYPEVPEGLYSSLTYKLGLMSQMLGQLKWTQEAADCVAGWDRSGGDNRGGPPVPSHSKLAYYNRTRTHTICKLCIVSAVARTGHMVIELADAQRALAWLLEAETVMPDIFREMVGKSDFQVVEELHYFLQSTWAKAKQKPVHSNLLYQFLGYRLPSEKVSRVLLLAEQMNTIARVAGTEDLWVPRPRQDHVLE